VRHAYRSFFSVLFLRAAKLHAAFGGGSMTLLPLVPGRPASGSRAAAVDLSKYTTLSEEQRAKLAAALEARQVCLPACVLFVCMCVWWWWWWWCRMHMHLNAACGEHSVRVCAHA
jgi:hypothetical protein